MSRHHFIPDWRKVVTYIRDPKTDWKPKAGLVLAIVYLLWPIDMFPDLIPLFGWLDDLGFGVLAVGYLINKSSKT